ncbi:MAG: hypothetical protein HYT37_01075 [Candidatus Sungbacteria bacterium]|nr:hypothetical protein [Candidatus Sungbacteria bacterium]
MGKNTLSYVSYRRVKAEAELAGSATHKGEQRRREGLGLHPLVDPAGYDVIRRSISRMNPEGDYFILPRGVAMLEETRLDTTGSMGHNVEIALEVLPKTYELLASGPKAVLKRYDVQMITSIFGDIGDNYVLCRSQAEMDEKIAEQMTLMIPEHRGGDTPEDPQYGLFGGAYCTSADINKYELKYYDFTVSDAPGRAKLDRGTLVRVFGDSVFEKVLENGYQIDKKILPSTKEVVNDLLKQAHAFFLQVGHDGETNSFWTSMFGNERVVILPQTQLLPHVKAAIIGLTEGVLDLQTTESFLRTAGLNQEDARDIVRSVSNIPIGAQKILPNFDKIPLKDAKFAKKGDLWPIGDETVIKTPSSKKKGNGTPPKKGKMWL